jgi:hypothetical protein
MAGNDMDSSLPSPVRSSRIQYHTRKKTKIRKSVVIVGFFILIIGIVSAAFPTQKPHNEEQLLGSHSFGPLTIRPEDPGPSWGLDMREGTFFELDLSASDTIRVQIGTPTATSPSGYMLTNIIFDQAATNFFQNVTVASDSTYQVQITDGAATPVTVSGNVTAKSILTTYQTLYPYSSYGTLVALGGLASLTFGILSRPKKRVHKRNKIND